MHPEFVLMVCAPFTDFPSMLSLQPIQNQSIRVSLALTPDRNAHHLLRPPHRPEDFAWRFFLWVLVLLFIASCSGGDAWGAWAPATCALGY